MKRIAEADSTRDGAGVTSAVPAAELRLSVRDLRLALAIAQAGTTAAAGDVLGLSQPAVSRAVLDLERRLGLPLFDRVPHGLRPNRAGARLATRAPALLGELAALESSLRPSGARRVRLGAECLTAYRWLPSALGGLDAEGLEIDLDPAPRDELLDAVVSGELDAALSTTARRPRGLVGVPVTSDETLLLLAEEHRLAGRDSLSAADLAGEVLLLPSALPEAAAARLRTHVLGADAGDGPARLPLTEAIIDLVRAGRAITAMSEWIAAAHLGRGLAVARPAAGRVQREWRLVYRPGELDEPVALLAERLTAAARAAARSSSLPRSPGNPGSPHPD